MDGGGGAAVTVQVKFAGRTIPVSLNGDATVRDLKSLLQPLTNVLPRGQKLIHKGKVLPDAAVLSELGVGDGAKVMLIASQGLHQGEGPITKEAISSTTRKVSNDKDERPQTVVSKSSLDRWKLTGVVALSSCQLKAVPEEIWCGGLSLRVLDLRNNSIQVIPKEIGNLRNLNKLNLESNELSEENICWDMLASLKLEFLYLSKNRLTSLPSTLGKFSLLREFFISNNKLVNLPSEIGCLKKLQVLQASDNRISSLPLSIGNCKSIVEIDLSCNLLSELPEAIGYLLNLKTLHLRNNGLKSVPSSLFKHCSQLSTLDLHGTEITTDILRQIEGWEEFDERRRMKHQKQLDFRAGSSGAFDEGADDDNRR